MLVPNRGLVSSCVRMLTHKASPDRYRRREALDGDILLARVTGAAVGEPGPVILHLPVPQEQRHAHSGGLNLQDDGQELVLLVHQLLHLLPPLAWLINGQISEKIKT